MCLVSAPRLCQSTLETLTSPTSILGWDKTYRDAVAIKRMLGFCFLWVEAICIIQTEAGDGGVGLADWREQAPEMGRIYAQATCVISATAALDIRDGCIFNKMPSGGGCHARQDGVESLDINLSRTPSTIVADLFRERTDRQRLASRGWGFQERVLVTCLLHFCDGMILFECNEG